MVEYYYSGKYDHIIQPAVLHSLQHLPQTVGRGNLLRVGQGTGHTPQRGREHPQML